MPICSRSCVQQTIPVCSRRPAAVLLILLVLVVAAGAQDQPAPPAESTPSGQTATAAPTSAQAPQAEGSGSAPLRVMVGKSLLINTTERLRRVSVTDATVADAIVVTPTQILIHGRSAGEVSLLIWDELERSRSFDLRVDVDVSACAEEEKRVFPDEQITVSPSRSAIVLSGHVSTEDVSKRAGMIAQAYSKNVVNVLTFGPVGAQEVLLEVKFAEVDRSAITQLGVNLFIPGTGNTIALSQTGQFGSVSISNTAPTTTTNANGTTTTQTPHGAHHHDHRFSQSVSVPHRHQFRRGDQGLAAEKPVADSGRTQPDRREWQRGQLSGGRPISLPHRAARPGLHRGHHLVQGIWRRS